MSWRPSSAASQVGRAPAKVAGEALFLAQVVARPHRPGPASPMNEAAQERPQTAFPPAVERVNLQEFCKLRVGL